MAVRSSWHRIAEASCKQSPVGQDQDQILRLLLFTTKMDFLGVSRGAGRSLLQTSSAVVSSETSSARIAGMGVGVLVIAAFVVLALAMWFVGERLEKGG